MKSFYTLTCAFVLLCSFTCNRTIKKENNMMLLSQDCYADRAIEEELNNVEGMVDLWQDIWILESLDKNQRWQPCELPKACQKQGLKVFFTGEVMRIFPGERRVATGNVHKSVSVSFLSLIFQVVLSFF